MTSRLLLGNDVNTFSVLQIRPVSATSFRQTSNLVKTLGLVWANGPQFHTISWDTVLSYPNKCTRVKVDSAHEMPYIGVYVCSVLTYLFRTVPCWPQGGLDDFTIGIFITQELQLIQGPKRSWKKITLKWRSRISVKEKNKTHMFRKANGIIFHLPCAISLKFCRCPISLTKRYLLGAQNSCFRSRYFHYLDSLSLSSMFRQKTPPKQGPNSNRNKGLGSR